MINSILKQRNQSMYSLAKETGIPYSTVHDLFSGKADPDNITLSSASRLAAGLGLSLTDFSKVIRRDQINRIPEEFRPAFWDTDFEKLDPEINKNFIITRMYTKGGIRAIRWVEDTYTYDEIRTAAMKRRDLNPIVANFLSSRFKIARKDMNYYRMGSNVPLWNPIPKPDRKNEDTHLASVEDIACMKAVAIGQRGAKKDFFDLYQILNSGMTMQNLARLLKEKYGKNDYAYLYMGMTYFEDAEEELLGNVFTTYSWDEIKRYFTANADGFRDALLDQ